MSETPDDLLAEVPDDPAPGVPEPTPLDEDVDAQSLTDAEVAALAAELDAP